MAESFALIQDLPDDELIRRHDRIAPTAQVGTQHYLNLLNWRHQDRQTEAMLGYTRRIKWMTIAITAATAINLGIAIGMLVVMIITGD